MRKGFFGRTEQIQRLKQKFKKLYEDSIVENGTTRLMPVLGPSGCGKSSLVKAGLIPTLRTSQLCKGSGVRIEVFRPRTRPVEIIGRRAGSIVPGVARRRGLEISKLCASNDGFTGIRKLRRALVDR